MSGDDPVPSRPGRTIELRLDELLTLAFLTLLVALGLATEAPVLEPLRRSRLTSATLVGLCVVASIVVVRRSPQALRRLVRDWWPGVGVLAVYESLKHMHANRITEWLGISPKDALMLALDEQLFGKALPLYLDAWTWPWFQNLMWLCYAWVYYLGPVVLLGWSWLASSDRQLFHRLRAGLVLGLLGGYVLYLLVPVAGPLFLIGDQFHHPIPHQPALRTLVFDKLRYNWDCFPSLHTAIPWLLTVLAWRHLAPWARAICTLGASGVTLATLALRYHYGVDLLAAFAWVALVVVAVEALARRNGGVLRVSLPAGRRPQ